jgi:hypothetical protein
VANRDSCQHHTLTFLGYLQKRKIKGDLSSSEIFIMKYLILLSFFMAIVSCTTPLSKGGKELQVVDKIPTDKCKQVGQVESKNMMESSARNELINNAAELGGNTLVIYDVKTSGSYAIYRGDVYQCP